MKANQVMEEVRHADDHENSGALPALVFASLGAINFFRIGCQLVITAWSAVDITGRANSVGQVLLISSLANLVVSPIAGKIIDSSERKRNIIILGHLGIVVSGCIPFLSMVSLSQQNGFPILIAATVLATVSGTVASCAMDYFMKRYITPQNRINKLASINLATQIALIIGVTLGGGIISTFSLHQAFIIISICGLASILLSSYSLPNLKISSLALGKRDGAGPTLYLKYPILLAISCCAALAFSIGQVTNTLLSALISIHFGKTSISYSIVEASWSIGAFCAGVFLATKRSHHGRISHDLLLIVCMALLVAAIPSLTVFPMLIATHVLLGVGFSCVRIRSETRFLVECPDHLLGRFRTNGLTITSIIGVAIYLTPTIWPSLPVSSLYLIFGGMIITAALAVIAFLSWLNLEVGR